VKYQVIISGIKVIRNLNSGLFKFKLSYLFLERNLYPNKILINVKMLMPPSIGIHGGGQQGVPPGFPG
tara:strand:+ start:325 stop:528 length:204 start_codon:yes stop_codon:yes gene_type:complete